MAQGDKNADQKVSREEFAALADAWYTKLDTSNSGTHQPGRLPDALHDTACRRRHRPHSAAQDSRSRRPATNLGPDNQVGTWPEFNTMIGGFFKFHWNDGQEIYVKVDEPNHPLTAAFKGKPQLLVIDETYTMGRETYSRKNLRVLTSVDYAKMSAEDKAKESNPQGRRRLRAELDPPRRQRPGLLRGARPQREDLRDDADPRARPRRDAVRPR